MASRIRTVKPELFRHEGLFEAEQDSGLPLRLAFIGLFTVCDRDGIFRWQPRQIKLDVMPYDSHDFSRVLDALMTRGFIRRYASGSEEYGVIPTFLRHQVINNREKNSVYPPIHEADKVYGNENSDLPTEEARVIDASATRHGNVQGEGKGKGREGEQEGEQERVREARRNWLTELIELGVSEKHAKDWLEVRRGKKAKMTDTVLDGIHREARIANVSFGEAIRISAESGWQGFKADWLNKPAANSGGRFPTKSEAIQAANQKVLDEVIQEDNERRRALGEIIDDAPLAFDDDLLTIEGSFFRAD